MDHDLPHSRLIDSAFPSVMREYWTEGEVQILERAMVLLINLIYSESYSTNASVAVSEARLVLNRVRAGMVGKGGVIGTNQGCITPAG